MGGKRFTVAASIAAVEASKDQLGICRWNYSLRSTQQFLARQISSYSSEAPAKKPAAPGEDAGGFIGGHREIENTFGKVMELSCWGPTTVRF